MAAHEALGPQLCVKDRGRDGGASSGRRQESGSDGRDRSLRPGYGVVIAAGETAIA
jgi:hypothetical protein